MSSPLLSSWSGRTAGPVLGTFPVALLVEGPPPALTTTNVVGLAWLGLAGAALVVTAVVLPQLPLRHPLVPRVAALAADADPCVAVER